ncbi:hypothetical protein F5B18DRAFT_601871 [Nemania serpens]|nr:hypothetical protein F5B18DRAFT_601871 [Nemania serpens]
MDEPLIVNLNEEPIEDGEFRTRNEKDQNFRPNLVDRGNTLSTKVDIVGITHGKISKNAGFATMLVFELRFLATGGRRFKKATVTFRFEDAGGATASDPVVHAIAPKDKWALNKTERVQNVKWSINTGANVGSDPAAVEAGILWEMEEPKNRTYYTGLVGEKRLMRRDWTGEANAVIWTLEENKDKTDGIPTLLRAAVLLRRRENVPFSFTVKVKTDVDFVGEVKTLFGLERKDPIDPVEVDPANFPEAGLATISSLDPQLHNLDKMDKLNLKKVAGVMVSTVLDDDELTTVEYAE